MKEEKNKKNILKTDFSIGGVSLRLKAVLAQNLSVMLRSGLTITEAFDILIDQFSGRLKNIISNIKESVLAGNSLWVAFSKHPKIFSNIFINTIKAGETAGNLEENLGYLAKQLNKQREIKEKIKAAIFYPAIILALSIVLGLVLAFVILPKITPILLGLKVELPLSTRMLIFMADIIEQHGTIILIVLAGSIIFSIWLIKQKFIKPFSHRLFFYLPIVKKVVINKNLAELSRNLGMLLKSGLSFDQALEITANTVNNYHYKKVLKKINSRVSQGDKFSDNLKIYKNYFPKLYVGLITVGERSGNLEEEFLNLADIYEVEVDNTIKTLSTAIEPFLLIIIGIIVGGLALSIITPIYKVTGNIYR